MPKENDASAIQLFAESCEALNNFARTLWDNNIFGNTFTGADIRNYESGWRLEKYVESEVAAERGLSAAWWLELGQRDSKWIVASNVSVGHSELHIDLPEHVAIDITELKYALEKSVNDLIATTNPDSNFVREVKKLQKASE